MSGPIALVGSGEYLSEMDEVDRFLLVDQPPRVVMLPTAAGEEDTERIEYWCDLGTTHFRTLGFDSVALRVLNRADAHDANYVAQIAGAGLIYLSGGSPAYLSQTLRDTPVWEAVVRAWHDGAALAGCSAGACALSAIAGGFRHLAQVAEPGLNVVPHLAVIPHFDRFDLRKPNLAVTVRDKIANDLTLIGIDERTALVGGPETFTVMGEQSVWWLGRDGTRVAYRPGTRLVLRPQHGPEVAV